MTDRDRFGGWTEITFEPTGFFRLERTEERDWFVTPEGNAFLSFGGNHVQTSPMQADYNLDFWAEKLGIEDPSDKEQFLVGYRKKVKQDLPLLGWNTLGCHSSQRFYPESFMPYVCQMRFVDVCHYMHCKEEDFWDVWTDEFVAHCEERAQKTVAPRADDPLVLGYSMTDCPIWTDADAAEHGNNIYGWERERLPTWPRVLRNLGAESPGKRVYVETMRELYKDDIAGFNQTYGTAYGSFDELLQATAWRPQTDPQNAREAQDNLTFLEKVVDKCYEIEVATIRKYDPNHLILGDKLNGNVPPPDSLIEIAGRHFDLIFFQFYALWNELEPFIDRLARLTGKPIMHGDASCSVPYDKMPDPFGPHLSSQEERVEQFHKMFYGAFVRSDFVGWNWCGWMDSWASRQPGKQHSGVQDPFGNFYPIQEALLQFSVEMYDVATGKLG